jgi:hypothetical protein
MADGGITFTTNMVNNFSNSILPEKYINNIIVKKVEDKKIIICIHRDLSKNDIDLLYLYGKVLFFEDIYQNIELSSLVFDYLVIDLRKEIHRNYYKINMYQNDGYYFILYRWWFEGNNGVVYNNELTEFPTRQTTKENYNKLLVFPNIYEPKWYISFLRLCCSIPK